MVGTIILQSSILIEENSNKYIVIPVQYNEDGKIIRPSEEIKNLRKEFKEFNDALSYSKSLKDLY